MKISKNAFGSYLAMTLVIAVLVSCGSKKEDSESEDLVESPDSVKTTVVNVGGELFSVPSPIQTAFLIQKNGIGYDKSVLSETSKANHYSTDFSRALNLGVYGADLGYVALYSQTQDALSYLSSVKQLSDKLGISAAFDEGTMTRFKNNITSKDSMMKLVGIAFRGSNAYLKQNRRDDISSLVLAGGWIEGMHLCVMANGNKPNKMVRERIASQKQAVTSLIKVLSTSASPEVSELIIKLSRLAEVYQGMQYKYKYVEPATDTIKKVTHIKSETEVRMSDEQLEQISSRVEELRSFVVNITQS